MALDQHNALIWLDMTGTASPQEPAGVCVMS